LTALPKGAMFYNPRTDGAFGPLYDPTALLYVYSSDLDFSGKLKPGIPIEPLVLRARAGECIKLTLRNKLSEKVFDLNGFNELPMTVEGFNNNDIVPSPYVGLHPQLLYYDVSRYDAANVGVNATQTVPPGQSKTYEWYAGDITINPDGTVKATPIEFGATNLISSDRIEHAGKGAFGSLIIEPANATWKEGPCLSSSLSAVCTRTSADVYLQSSFTGALTFAYREFVAMFQNDVNLRTEVELPPLCGVPTGGVVPGFGAPIENLACEDDPEDSGAKAVNYRTEPLWKRMQFPPGTVLNQTDEFKDWFDVLSNTKVGGDPETPVFTASPGTPIRFRVLQAGGHGRNLIFDLNGHIWDKEPYVNSSTKIGQNTFSMWEGARFGVGPTFHFDAVIRNGAGGKYRVPGDYLFHDHGSFGFAGGLWGILRVE
jgi:hypothetical protein